MSKEQQELLDKAYNKYQSQTMFRTDDLVSLEELDGMCLGTGEIKKVYRQYAPKDFINNCKNNPEFSEKWGLKIEERELSLEERHFLLTKTKLLIPMADDTKDNWLEILNEKNTPTKLITVTHNNKTITNYE